MSMELMVGAMKIEVGNPLRKLVLIKLADNANDQGECWPSYQHIADQCEIDRSTVRKHIKQLQQQGLLRVEHRLGVLGNSSNLYRLTLNGVGPKSPPVGPESTGGCFQPTPPVGPESTRTSHSFEPVNEPIDIGEKGAQEEKPKKRQQKAQTEKFDPLTCKPENVSDEAWAGFVEMRATKGKGKPLTKRACEMIATKLKGLPDADVIVDRSTINGWADVYPESGQQRANSDKPSLYHGLPVHTPEMYGEDADGDRF